MFGQQKPQDSVGYYSFIQVQWRIYLLKAIV